MSVKVILCLALILGLNSCMLEKEGEHFVNVDKKPKPNVSATLEYTFSQGSSVYYPVKDTIWLDNDLFFNITSKDYYSSEIFLNGGKILETKERNFKIQKNLLTDGIHDLMVRQTVYSRTGSIADRANQEFTKVTNNYVISAGTDTYVPKIMSATIINGSLVLTWNPYQRGNFISYEITRRSQFSYQTTKSYKITDKKVSVLRDSSYVGGRETYSLSVDKGGKILVTTSAYPVNFSSKPEFELSQINNSRMKLTWQKPVFYGSVKNYAIKWEGVTIADNIPSTSFSIEFSGNTIFGQPAGFTLTSVSRENNQSNPVTNSEFEYVTIGKKLPFDGLVDRVVYNSNKNTFSLIRNFSGYQNEVLTFDKDFKLSSSNLYNTPLDIAISPNGLYACVIQSGRYIRVDPVTFSPIEVIPFASLGITDSAMGNSSEYSDVYSSYMSNDGFIITPMSKNTRVVDLVNKKVLLSVVRNLSSNIKIDISSDSKYSLIGSKVYELNSGTYLLKFNLPYDESSLRHIATIPNSANILIATSTGVYMFDCSSNVEVKNFTSAPNGFDCFDKHSLNFVTPSKNYINIITGLGGTLKVFPNTPVVLEGGMLFTKRAIYYGNNYVIGNF